MSTETPRVAILASGDRKSGGGGSTAERFIIDALGQEVALDVGLIICNNSVDAVPGLYSRFDDINRGLDLKGDDKVEVVNIGPATHPDGMLERGQTLTESEAICRLLEERDIDFVAMLGYLRILTGEFVETWGWKPEYAEDEIYGYRNGIYHPNARITNNHPGILPFTADTHGPGTHLRALDLFHAGRIEHTAMTWHLASALVDGGPIIREEPISIRASDDVKSLGARVQDVEKEETAFTIERHIILHAEHQRANS